MHRRSFHKAGHAHELTFSCYRRFPFSKAERTCQWLAESIVNARIKYSFQRWAYVFMPDHVHLLIDPNQPDAEIGKILRAIKAPVAKKAIRHLEENAPHWIPKMSRQRGRKTERLFWQSGGGYDRNVIQKKALLSMVDDIHANPVRKSYVERSRDWYWSSAAWFDDQTDIPIEIEAIPFDWLE